MSIRGLGTFLAVVLTTGCASAHRMPVPNWQRYQAGELSGFLHAPDEAVATEVPEATVSRIRGRFFSPATEWAQSNRATPLRSQPTIRVPEPGSSTATDLSDVDSKMFVVELRGPGSSQKVQTVATRSGVFDFGPLPNGTYTLKATRSGSSTVLGWTSKVRTIIVSDSADAAAEIVVW